MADRFRELLDKHGVTDLGFGGGAGGLPLQFPQGYPAGERVKVEAAWAEFMAGPSRQDEIMAELASLDAEVQARAPRVLEDLAAGQPVHESVQALFGRKAALRAELAALGGA